MNGNCAGVGCGPTDVSSVGVLPLIPLILGGSAILGAGVVGYKIGKPEYDARGNRLPGLVESATREVGRGVGNALTVAVVIGLAYMIFLRESGKH